MHDPVASPNGTPCEKRAGELRLLPITIKPCLLSQNRSRWSMLKPWKPEETGQTGVQAEHCPKPAWCYNPDAGAAASLALQGARLMKCVLHR